MFHNNRNLLFKAVIIVLCIISCVHLFGFLLFETNTSSNYIRTYSDLEQFLCKVKVHKKKTLRQRQCPQDGIITVMQGGRLGNQIWEYASVWAMARETGLEPYIPLCIKVTLSFMFDKLTLPTLDDIGDCLVQTNFRELYVNDTALNFLKGWNFTNQSIILPQYIIQPELIATSVQDIVQEFKIKKSLLKKSQKVLHFAVKYLNIKAETFVGVHVRRTDYFNYIKRKFNANPVKVSFFKNAMAYFEKKYPKTIFIIISDDPYWCFESFKFKKNAYIPGIHHVTDSSALDMTLLASCNHTIYDYGTYGQWGAIFAGGETIYYNLSNRHSSYRFGTYMKNWHTL